MLLDGAALPGAVALQGIDGSSGPGGADGPVDFLAILGVLLFFGLLLPRVLRPLHLPLATSLILLGSLMGPHGLGFVAVDPGLSLFGFIGATFLMLLAGIEARDLGIHPWERRTARLLVLDAAPPAIAGIVVARAFGYGWTPSLFVGTIFLSSSIMLNFGVVKAAQLGGTTAGQLLKRAAVIQDLAASVVALVLFQTLAPHPRYPFPVLAGLLLSSVILLRMFLPEVVEYLLSRFGEGDGEGYEARLRVVISLMLLIIFAFSAFDVQPVVAAFLVGFSLAGVPAVAPLRTSLQTLGYALFIPVFLFVIGLETDLTLLVRFQPRDLLVVSVLAGAVGSKLVGGFLGARWAGLAQSEAVFIGVASTMKLTVPLSATYVARDLGLIDSQLFSALVVLSVATSMIAPLVLSLIRRRALRPTDAA